VGEREWASETGCGHLTLGSFRDLAIPKVEEGKVMALVSENLKVQVEGKDRLKMDNESIISQISIENRTRYDIPLQRVPDPSILQERVLEKRWERKHYQVKQVPRDEWLRRH
jgi:hypothetical protein